MLLYTKLADEPPFTFVDPATGHEHIAEPGTTWYYPVDVPHAAPVSLSSLDDLIELVVPGETDTYGAKEDYLASGDGRWLAVVVASPSTCNHAFPEQIEQYYYDGANLLLVDMQSNTYREIVSRMACVWRMAWQP